MKKLIKILRLAHAIEIGAYEAYEGHSKTVKSPHIKKRLKEIQKDEWFHKQAVGFMLIDLEAESNKALDLLMYWVGKFISFSCYVIGYRAAMWGAKIFEILGSDIYFRAHILSLHCDVNMGISGELRKMCLKEREHEEFFRWCLGSTETL